MRPSALRPATLAVAVGLLLPGRPRPRTRLPSPDATRAAETPAAPVAPAADTIAPSVTAPVASIRTNAKAGASTVPFTVRWTRSDASGIARSTLQRQVDGGSWETVALPSATSSSVVVNLRPPHEYAFRVRATDRRRQHERLRDGSTVPGAARERDDDPALSTTGAWQLRENAAYLGGRALGSGDHRCDGDVHVHRQPGGLDRDPRRQPRAALDRRRRRPDDDRRPRPRTTTEYRRLVFRHAWASSGTHTLSRSPSPARRATRTSTSTGSWSSIRPRPNPVLVGAGDIATCGLTGDSRTAALLDGIAGRVFARGRPRLPGRHRRPVPRLLRADVGPLASRTSPAPGNHEYHSPARRRTSPTSGHGPARPAPGWYAYDLGTWRIYVLNSNCTDRSAAARLAAGRRWLRADLAANPRACVAAVWHHPRFSSGEHGNNPAVADLWRALEAGRRRGRRSPGTTTTTSGSRPRPATASRTRRACASSWSGTGGAALRPFGTIRS